jgi:hypothetical protein
MPMQPRPNADTTSELLPSLRYSMGALPVDIVNQPVSLMKPMAAVKQIGRGFYLPIRAKVHVYY